MNPLDVARAELAPYTLAIKGILAALVIGTILYQHWRIGELKGDLKLHEAAEQGYAGAQRTNLSTIADLRTRLQSITDGIRADQDAARAAADQAEAHAAAVEAELAHTRGELKHVYEQSAAARAWGNAGVDADVAARLPGGADR